jgi:zeaxanthin glucosyltransferase
MTALALRLKQRGHQVILFGIADTEARVRAAGIDFHLIGATDYPFGTLQKLDQQLSELKGISTFRFTVERLKNTACMILRDGPEAVRSANLDAMLIDEADMGGNIAEYLGLPFVSIAFFPPLVQDDYIPPFCFGWNGGQNPFARLRNRLGMRLLSRIAAPIYAVVNEQRKSWNLKPLAHPTESLSPLAQITQLPEVLEFPTPSRPTNLHYTGPFVNNQQRPPIDFPWHRLDGRPLLYASLGTLQNGSEQSFKTIAEASSTLNVQLVLSLGGGLNPARLGTLPGTPILVRYAPQLELLKQAAAVITHAGLNTVLESLAEGVPLVAIPQGNDQPGVAARVAAKGAGIVIPAHKLNVPRLRTAVQSVLEENKYRAQAHKIQSEMQKINALETAANIIEAALELKPAPKPEHLPIVAPDAAPASPLQTAADRPLAPSANLP